MGNDQTKTVLDERKEPITYFAINIKQPDKLHLVPSDTFLSNIVVKVLETHCRYLVFVPAVYNQNNVLNTMNDYHIETRFLSKDLVRFVRACPRSSKKEGIVPYSENHPA